MKTGYRGYQAYDYLTPGEDYRAFPLARWDWAGQYRLPLTQEQEQRVLRLAKDCVYIGLHEHPTLATEDISQLGLLDREGRESCAYEALSHSYLGLRF